VIQVKVERSDEVKGKGSKELRTYLPPRARKRDPRDKCVVEICNVKQEVVQCHALGPTLIPQTLDGIKLLQRRVPGTIHEPKYKKQRNHRLRLPRALNHGNHILVIHILAIPIFLEIRRNQRACYGENEHEAAGGDEELGAPAPGVGVEGAEDSAGEGDDVLHAVVEEARASVGDACAAQERGVVVGDGAVAGPLAEKGHGEDEHGAVAGFAGIEELLGWDG
jgi:hypothetical protein